MELVNKLHFFAVNEADDAELLAIYAQLLLQFTPINFYFQDSH